MTAQGLFFSDAKDLGEIATAYPQLDAKYRYGRLKWHSVTNSRCISDTVKDRDIVIPATKYLHVRKGVNELLLPPSTILPPAPVAILCQYLIYFHHQYRAAHIAVTTTTFHIVTIYVKPPTKRAHLSVKH